MNSKKGDGIYNFQRLTEAGYWFTVTIALGLCNKTSIIMYSVWIIWDKEQKFCFERHKICLNIVESSLWQKKSFHNNCQSSKSVTQSKDVTLL